MLHQSSSNDPFDVVPLKIDFFNREYHDSEKAHHQFRSTSALFEESQQQQVYEDLYNSNELNNTPSRDCSNQNLMPCEFMQSSRPKVFIITSQKMRRNYLHSKKGRAQQTNDLSINVCTLLRNLCKQYQEIEKVSERQAENIEEFLRGKANIANIGSLFEDKKLDNNEKEGQEQIQQKQEDFNGLKQYFNQKLKLPYTMKNILSSGRMKISNKIVILKYLQKIRQGVSGQRKMKGWKQRK